ncbi:hypothetical protein M885DRAFT_521522 [Pelagophyceae sp. CCMP2097]|nr:hypothetical protein M885DRAFT_521522 [Pelagophyceae sp. CCMP2097]
MVSGRRVNIGVCGNTPVKSVEFQRHDPSNVLHRATPEREGTCARKALRAPPRNDDDAENCFDSAAADGDGLRPKTSRGVAQPSLEQFHDYVVPSSPKECSSPLNNCNFSLLFHAEGAGGRAEGAGKPAAAASAAVAEEDEDTQSAFGDEDTEDTEGKYDFVDSDDGAEEETDDDARDDGDDDDDGENYLAQYYASVGKRPPPPAAPQAAAPHGFGSTHEFGRQLLLLALTFG